MHQDHAAQSQSSSRHSLEDELASIATDLNLLVDRMEFEWGAQHCVDGSAVQALHSIRQRAERMFAG